MMVSAVAFDWYGTLAAPSPDDFWTRMSRTIEEAGGQPHTDALAEWNDIPQDHRAWSAEEAIYRRWEDGRLFSLLTRCGVPEPRRSALAAEISDVRYSRRFPLFPDAVPTLVAMRDRGLRTAICSNWDWGLSRQLRENDASDLFDVVVCSASVGFRKPHPRLFAALAQQLGVEPSRTLFVGDDWKADVQGARDSGFRVAHVAREGCHANDHGSVPCLPDLCRLHEFLDGDAYMASLGSR